MAVVGEASVIVRAVTTSVKNDIQKAFDGAGRVGERAGADAGSSFSRGFQSNNNVGALFGKNLSQKDINVFKEARERFLSLARVGYTLGASLTALGGIIGSLIGGLGTLVAVVGGATPALLGLSGAFLAVAASAAVLRATFGGVGEAISAGAKVGANAAADADRLAAANDRLSDAYYNLDETIRDNTKRKADAQEAESDAAIAVADAAIAVERAERSYQGAVKNTQKALEEVTEAREEAKEAIQQLRFELEGGVISEKKARLEFEKARDSLQRVQDLPPNSRARREAELAFAEADLNLRRAIDKNNDLRKSTAKANREGVDGNKVVIAAQEKLAEAKTSESDAQIDAARSTITYREALEDLKKAQDALTDGGEVDRQNLRALELANRELEAAIKAQAAAAKGSGFDEYKAALDKLSPAAQDFVKYILSLKDAFEELRKKLQEAFFPAFTDAVKLLVNTYLIGPDSLEDALIRIAAKLGELSKLFAEAFTTPEKIAEITALIDSVTPIIDALGKALIALASAFVTLQAAFIPYTIEFAQFIQKKAEAFQKTVELKNATGELATIYKNATDIVRGFGEALGNAFSAFGTIIAAAVGPGSAGEFFTNWLIGITEKWETATKSLSESGELKTFLLDLTVNFTKILEIIGLIGLGMIKIAATEGFGYFLDRLKESVIEFNKLGVSIAEKALPAFGDFILAFTRFIVLFADAGAIAIFFNTLAAILNTIVALLDNEVGRAVLAVTGSMLAFSAATGLASKAAMFYANSLKGAVIGGVAFGQNLALLLQRVPLLGGFATTLGTRMAGLTGIIAAGGAPLWALVAAVVAVLAIFKLAYDASENLRNAVGGLVDGIKNALSKAFEDIKKTIQEVFPIFKGTSDFFKDIGDILAITLVPILGRLAGILIGTVSGAFQRVIYFIGAAKDFLMIFANIFQGVFKLLTGDVKGAVDEMKQIFTSLGNFVKNILKGIAAPFVGALNGIIDVWNGASARFKVNIPKWVPIIGGNSYTLPTIPRINLANLAEGGIVMPSMGGTIARIGEAGRPERVEPLDPSGLSKRDRALIEMLAGPAGGVNITVNPSAGMDERELAALVSRQLAFQLRKGAA
jgi:hypothetical protein